MTQKDHKQSKEYSTKKGTNTEERCIKDKRVFAYHHGNRWIINYNQLEPVIMEFFVKTNYKIVRRKRKKRSRKK
jgi:hypothetical protein